MNKLFTAAYTKGKDDEKREIYARASEGVVDRDKEVIRWNAWDLEDFKRHPVLLLAHNYSALGVGRVTSIDARKDGLFFAATYATSSSGLECWETIKSTGLAAYSVGFAPIESSMIRVRQLEPSERASALKVGMSDTDSVRVYTRVSLLEISHVSVPALQSALLIEWKTKGLKDKALNDAMQVWQDDIDLAELEPAIERAVTQAIAKVDLPGQIAGAVKERARELRNEEWREFFLKKIMDDYRAARAAEAKAAVQRREIARAGKPDPNSPAEVEAYAKAQLATIDFEKTANDAVTLAIAKARGKVY